MKIAIVAATEKEFALSKKYFQQQNTKHELVFFTTGVGILQATVALMKLLSNHQPQLIVQIGIAGCFNKKISLGNVVVVEKEFLCDGVFENKQWKDLFDLKLIEKSNASFINKAIVNNNIKKFALAELQKINAITVTEVTTQKAKAIALQKKYNVFAESMEGVALHYVCNDFKIPYLQMRGLSNYIGERDKQKWVMKDSIKNVNIALQNFINQL